MKSEMMWKSDKTFSAEVETKCNGDKIILEILKRKETNNVYCDNVWGDAWGPLDD